MVRTPTFSALLFLLLPFGTLGFEIHELLRRFTRDTHSWNYEEKTGPANWHQMYKLCGGDRQSPIDIMNTKVDLNDELDAFEFENYNQKMEGAIMKNNGHTVKVTPGPKDSIRLIKEGGMDDDYKFLQLHFHWGATSKRGSEHLIDGQSFPLEMHLVHMNTNYKTQEAASHKEDGLAVLAVLFKLDSEDNAALEPIIDKLDEVMKENQKVDLDDFTLESLMPDDLMPYYRYEGSLTTPPCSEIVIWTVFKDFVPISEKQLQKFRSLKEEDAGEDEEILQDNFRPVQDWNLRVVEVSGDQGPSDGKANAGASLIPSVAVVLSAISFFL